MGLDPEELLLEELELLLDDELELLELELDELELLELELEEELDELELLEPLVLVFPPHALSNIAELASNIPRAIGRLSGHLNSFNMVLSPMFKLFLLCPVHVFCTGSGLGFSC